MPDLIAKEKLERLDLLEQFSHSKDNDDAYHANRDITRKSKNIKKS